MKDKKFLVLLIFLAIIGSVMLFLLRPIQNAEDLPAKDQESLRQNVIKLQSQVKQLQGLLRGFVLVNHSINTTFLKEKSQRGDLEKLLKDITAQNEILTQDLTQSRVSLELTKELRGKVDAAGKLIANLNLKPGKENEIKKQLENLNKTLNSIETKIPDILKENTSYKAKTQDLNQASEKQRKEIAQLKNELIEKQFLTKNLNNLSEELKRAKLEKAILEKAGSQLKETNLSLTTKLDKLGEELNNAHGSLSKAVQEKETEIKQNRETLQRSKQLEDAILGLTQKNQTLENELTPLKNQLAALKEEKLRLTKEIEETRAAGQNAEILQEQLKQLQVRSEELSKNYADLKNEYIKADETIKQNTLALGKRADRILVLSEKLTETQSGLKDLRSKYQEIEKESVALREQNVAAQLEREELKIQLTQTRVKLKEFESQAAQITSILKGINTTEASLGLSREQDENKKIEVELYQSKDSLESVEIDLLPDNESAGIAKAVEEK
ncbi:MAG: hypothetical protein Q7J72_04050 [Candidatus Omnitrophota bacterium]|nr:hypothetical protein [Candidatus Omnitrophota bacterium]